MEWQNDSLAIDEKGHVNGSAYVEKGDYFIDVSVSSYDYENDRKTNHVPHVVVTHKSGEIVSEPHGWDSNNPDKAIDNAKNLGAYVYNNLNEFVD